MTVVAFIDTEIDPRTRKILDIGAVRTDGVSFHGTNMADFISFLQGSDYICGHNIINHDLKYVADAVQDAGIGLDKAIDTLYLSPLLFPKKPYHKLLKDDKLQSDDINNPLNDSFKAQDLFNDEVAAFKSFDEDLKEIYYRLLSSRNEFQAFFRYVRYRPEVRPGQNILLRRLFGTDMSSRGTAMLIQSRFQHQICANADLQAMIKEHPIGLAYCLALTDAIEKDRNARSVHPSWVLHNFPDVQQIMTLLRSTPCQGGCEYCNRSFDIHAGLRHWFGFSSFRTYGEEPLQEKAVEAAVDNKSILAVFPTGGGKSLTFQLPALMAGENTGGLTVVISPLQSLMKDQVDNLEKAGITEAATINGLLDPIERAKAFERVEDGTVSILYIAPESLRSKSVERLILGRRIDRFVIDEAHCFSSWGQDFRVDYLYIADFIRSIQTKKNLSESIPVSCFTATAKPQVIEDIRNYFKNRLFIDLQLFSASVSRTNLHYMVIKAEDKNEKYRELRNLILERTCPVIVYVSRTKTSEVLAARLAADGFSARAYHGKMTSEEKTANQNAFMSGDVRVMVATSAFGMGVDKKDVGLVVHYEISDSLENYVQEAGRAGRDQSMEAECYILFNEEDLSKHFLLLNQTKITVKEIRQVWRAVKDLTRVRSKVSESALEIARKAGWDDSVADVETRVRTAISSLEQAGYIRRGQNMPRVFATGILARTAQEAIDKINASPKFDDKTRIHAIRIIRKLIASRSRQQGDDEQAESRIDYISDHLGITKENVIQAVNLLREEKILADTKDMTVYINKEDTVNKSQNILKIFNSVEDFLLPCLDKEETVLDLKELNEQADAAGVKAVSPKRMKTILNFWAIKGRIRKSYDDTRNHVRIQLLCSRDEMAGKILKLHDIATFIVEYLYGAAPAGPGDEDGNILVEFSVTGILDLYRSSFSAFADSVSISDVEDALFYLSRIGAVKIEGGFLVIYNAMTIERLEKNNKRQYKNEDYARLAEFYKSRIQQIHIVGEYARKMIKDYNDALQFVEDYFRMNYPAFLLKYFKDRNAEIETNITPAKFRQLFGSLSPAQLAIIKDSRSKYIVVAAGPGSGKTKVLVHKLASLLLMEDVRHEQLLMLTFSRAAATEFKRRLYDLIGNAAAFVEIKTFHSYCFDLLGKIGSVERSDDVVRLATEKILEGEVDPSRITRTVLVVDESQDMDQDAYSLVKTLIDRNEDLRVILVGDDDQNIYRFRGSGSEYMEDMLHWPETTGYELVENFRSRSNLVEFSNKFAATISHRLKRYPVVARSQEKGGLEITRYPDGTILFCPVVRFLSESRFKGSVAVLTRTNVEALQITGMLLKAGLPARLIQANEGFSLYNLVEIRYFMQCIGLHEDGAAVDEEEWEESKRNLYSVYGRSSRYELCAGLIKAFESEYRKSRYKSDFEVFVRESSAEDFVETGTSEIIVSTMHKTKGKEYDNVVIMLDNFKCDKDEERRLLYVAFTRAKNNLAIHLNTGLLDGIDADGLVRKHDNAEYSRPDEVDLVLGMQDVWLSDFSRRQAVVSKFFAGDPLYVKDAMLCDKYDRQALRFSSRFSKEYGKLQAEGYVPERAEVDTVLMWKNNEMTDEIRIILPRIHFVRHKLCGTDGNLEE